ncbi:MAG: membrane or secreted protein [Bacteroidota bacterium]
MKRILITSSFFLAITALTFWSFRAPSPEPIASLTGAWQLAEVNGEAPEYQQVALFSETYNMATAYDLTGKEFLGTNGGPFTYDGKTLSVQLDFNSQDTASVGQTVELSVSIQGDLATVQTGDNGAETQIWERLDEAGTPLSGHWQISGRMRNGEMQAIQRDGGPRKTIKMLTGTRFQWTAMNTETGKFHGCGGGNYTFEDGVYTENIEYFSRDNSRVGASLAFEGKVKGDDWHHSGKSSKGKPISEIWTRQ